MEIAASSDESDKDEMDTYDSSHPVHPFLKMVLSLLILWQAIFKVSDNAITGLLKLLRIPFASISRIFSIPMLSVVASKVPSSLVGSHKLNRDNFVKYVVCTKCHSIYSFEDCYKEDRNGKRISLTCKFVEFPRNKACGEILLKVLHTRSVQLYYLSQERFSVINL